MLRLTAPALAAPALAVWATAVALGAAPSPAQAQDAPKPLKRITMSLEKVLPLLNTAVVKVRTPSESQPGKADASPAAGNDAAAAKGGAKMTHLTGIRVGEDLAIVTVPDVDPAPTSYEVAVFDNWVAAPVVATDESGLYALLRLSGQRQAAPTLAAAPITPNFVVGAVTVGITLDIRTVWLEPGEKIELPPGAAVWAADGRFAGLTSAADGGTIIIPGADVLASAEELRAKVKPAEAAK